MAGVAFMSKSGQVAAQGKTLAPAKHASTSRGSLALVSRDPEAAAKLLKRRIHEAASASIRVAETLPEDADALIYLLDYAVLDSHGDQALDDLVSPLAQRLSRWGKQLLPAQRSVFVVLYNWEKFVARMNLAGALEWLEEKKLELLQKLERALARSTGAKGGFGGLAWRVWAVSLATRDESLPSGWPVGFGIAQLFQQAQAAAENFARRRRRQNRWAAGLLMLCCAAVAGLGSGLWLLAWRLYHPAPVVEEKDPTRHLPPLERLAWWLDRGRRLLRWEDWRQGSALVLDWPSWLAEVQRYRQAVAQLPRPEQREGEIWWRALQEVTTELSRVQERASVLGVEGVATQHGVSAPFAFTPPVVDEDTQAFTLDAFLTEVRSRWRQVREQFPAADLQPLPGDLPLEVAEDLRQLASQRYVALLEPVRAELRRQVYRLGEGQETLAAWRQLVQRGWLSGAARRELADWLVVAHMLQIWAGRTPMDPLDALSQFVLHESVPLPLGRVWLTWPPHLSPNPADLRSVSSPDSRITNPAESTQEIPEVLEPPSQLTLTLLMSDGRQTPLLYQRLETATPRQEEWPRYEYRLTTNVPWPGECYSYHPGVRMRVQAQVKDKAGRAWQLTWSEREARSQVFGFTVLQLTPRCHSPEEAPESGPLWHGVRLHLSVPLPVPDLLP